MARRSDHTHTELFDLAINAAQSIVTTAGVKKISARKVAALMGYSPGTIYNLFGHMDGLILHVNARTLDELHQQLSMTIHPLHPHQRLEELLNAYLGFVQTHRQRWNSLFEFSLHEGNPLPDWYQNKILKVINLLESVLQPMLPGFSPEEIAHNARVIWCGIHGVTTLALAKKLDIITSRPLEIMAHDLVFGHMHGLGWQKYSQ